LGYLGISLNLEKIEGYYKRKFFKDLYFSDFIIKYKKYIIIRLNKMYKWVGLCEQHAKNLHYNVGKLRIDCLKILQMYYKDYTIFLYNYKKLFKIN
jgi:hypothetical protein